MDAPLPYRTLAPWLRETFGRPVFRVALDAGSTCPNRDGTRGRGGCTYCDVEGSGTGALRSGLELEEQLEHGVRRIARREPGAGYIAYFQSYSNTYVSPERLDEVLAVLEPHVARRESAENPLSCIALATRPDTLEDWALDRLARLARHVPVWLELGLECADDDVLLAIQRLHTVAEFEDAVARAKARGLGTVGHAILGLPGDGREGARRTARVLADAGVEGVKVHQLMVLRRTVLEAQYRRGEVEVLDPETYVAWLADFVERLAPEQVLHRIAGDAPGDTRVAPDWEQKKARVRQRLADELRARGTRQGSARALAR